MNTLNRYRVHLTLLDEIGDRQKERGTQLNHLLVVLNQSGVSSRLADLLSRHEMQAYEKKAN